MWISHNSRRKLELLRRNLNNPPLIPAAILNFFFFCKCALFLQEWLIFASVTYFFICDLFFQIWPTFGKCLTHFSTCYFFLNATHFCTCDPFYQLWPILGSMTHFCKWHRFLKELHLYFKCDTFFLVSLSFATVTQSFNFCAYLKVWCIISVRLTCFWKCDFFSSVK